MAGDSQTGGGGSVYWSITVDRLDRLREETTCRDRGGRLFQQRGSDHDGVVGRDRFTISIKVPDDPKEAEAFCRLFQGTGTGKRRGRVTFTLPIEDDPSQIRITWGNMKKPRR